MASILPQAILFNILFCVAIGNVYAQDKSTCDGLWKYTHLDKAKGLPADVEVQINGEAGTYLAHLGQHKKANSPCRDVKFPVAVSRCTAEELDFHVDGESHMQGCPTFDALFKRTGPDTAEGTISRDQTVTMTRDK